MVITSAIAAVNRIVRILFESARMQARLVLHHPILPVGTVIQPAAFLLIVLSRDHPATRAQTTSILIAVVLTSLWGASLWTSGSILRREIADGTLARSMTSLSDARLVVIGKCAGATVVTFGLLLVTAIAMAALLRVRIGLGDLVDVFVGLILVAVSGIALGYLFSPGIFVITRYAQHWDGGADIPGLHPGRAHHPGRYAARGGAMAVIADQPLLGASIPGRGGRRQFRRRLVGGRAGIDRGVRHRWRHRVACG